MRAGFGSLLPGQAGTKSDSSRDADVGSVRGRRCISVNVQSKSVSVGVIAQEQTQPIDAVAPHLPTNGDRLIEVTMCHIGYLHHC